MNIDRSASLSGENGAGSRVFRRNVSRTRVKLCGMRRREDILAVNKILPDYAGFILAEGFRRTVTWEKARELGIDVDDTEKEQPILLHAKLGVYYAVHKYGITDPEVLDARVFSIGASEEELKSWVESL